VADRAMLLRGDLSGGRVLAREGKKIRRHFDSLGAAKTWREDAAGAVRQGRMRSPWRQRSIRPAETLIEGMRSGVILDRSGGVYKPSTVRSYEGALRLRIPAGDRGIDG